MFVLSCNIFRSTFSRSIDIHRPAALQSFVPRLFRDVSGQMARLTGDDRREKKHRGPMDGCRSEGQVTAQLTSNH